MTERISRYLREQQPETPCLVIDLDVVEHNYRRMRELLPTAHIFYAVKANPAAQILTRLATAGSKFDTASRGEIELVQAAGVAADRISFGNTIKKEKDIAWAYEQGVRLFAFDSEAELQKLVHAAEVALDHVEIDHEDRRLGLLLAQVTKNTLGHHWGVPRLKRQNVRMVSR